MSNFLSIEQVEDSVVICFARPESRNALSLTVLGQIDQALSAAACSAKRIIFTGSGRIFASGADLREVSLLSGPSAAEFARQGQALMNKIASIGVPTVAAINGACFGGAVDLALACQRRVASPIATFCHPGAGLGIVTGWGGTQRLPRLIGVTNALEMFLTAAPVNATEAMRSGLIDSIEEEPLLAALNS